MIPRSSSDAGSCRNCNWIMQIHRRCPSNQQSLESMAPEFRLWSRYLSPSHRSRPIIVIFISSKSSWCPSNEYLFIGYLLLLLPCLNLPPCADDADILHHFYLFINNICWKRWEKRPLISIGAWPEGGVIGDALSRQRWPLTWMGPWRHRCGDVIKPTGRHGDGPPIHSALFAWAIRPTLRFQTSTYARPVTGDGLRLASWTTREHMAIDVGLNRWSTAMKSDGPIGNSDRSWPNRPWRQQEISIVASDASPSNKVHCE